MKTRLIRPVSPLLRPLVRAADKLMDRAWVGALQYRLQPDHDMWGGPFNGQTQRRRLFDALVEALEPAYLVETGTHLGSTTVDLARRGRPVYSVEVSARRRAYAACRLKELGNVELLHGDSKSVLATLLVRLQDGGLYYLDAHWRQNNPLADELDAIYAGQERAVVMIDDFAVPDDPGYGATPLPAGGTLGLDFIADVCSRRQLALFFPTTPSAAEDGMRSGCVVVCGPALRPALEGIKLLRAWAPPADTT